MKIQWIKFFSLSFVAVVVATLGAGCAKQEQSDLGGISAWCTLQPQAYFINRVGGDLVSTQVLVRVGQSPEMYSPSAAQVAQLAQADVYFGIGMPLEASLFKRMQSSMAGVRIVQTGDGIAEAHEHSAHDHSAHDHGHHQEMSDPHIWMDPVRMIAVVEQIRDALIEVEPESAEVFRLNADALIVDLKALNDTIALQLSPFEGRTFFINHPALGHFAERYHLVQESIEESGTAPSAARIAELVQAARAAQVGAIYTQLEFGRTTATILAEALDVDVVELNVLPVDYISGMTSITDSLEQGFRNE
jgi:zinc transport system substrate-binding protein